MGVTMMGGLLTWLFVVQAHLDRRRSSSESTITSGRAWRAFKGGERYQPYYQVAALGAFTLALFIWLTPHTVLDVGR